MGDYIFESPDGGKTIYRRKVGEDERELFFESSSPHFYNNIIWVDIQTIATKNTTVKAALDQLIILYKLAKEE